MKIIPTAIPEVLLAEPRVFGDERGFFFESYNERQWREKTGLQLRFVQHNHSRSARHVLRGLHYQIRQPQGKLVRVIRGEVYDVAVDLRQGSSTFGRWVGEILSEDNKRLLWIPPGFAHGFLVLSAMADFLYLATEFYAPEHERTIAWNDPELNISWPLPAEPVLSDKDRGAASFREAEVYP